MAKSLGQIHTVNFAIDDVQSGDRYILDLAGSLWEQLEHRVRQGNYFKIVGIDMDIQDASEVESSVVDGRLFYYSPTRGRCAAYRAAFKAMMENYSDLGVPARDNYAYDFRVPFNNSATNIADFRNKAYFEVDGAGDPLPLQLADDSDVGVFTKWNASLPQLETSAGAGNIVGSGYHIWTDPGNTDWDGIAGTAELIGTQPSGDAPPRASLEAEYIPFNLANEGDGNFGMNFNWRPDPALYLPNLTGQFYLAIDEALSGDQERPGLQLAVHVAGWKSIMGDPDTKKKRRGKKRGRRSK